MISPRPPMSLNRDQARVLLILARKGQALVVRNPEAMPCPADSAHAREALDQLTLAVRPSPHIIDMAAARPKEPA